MTAPPPERDASERELARLLGEHVFDPEDYSATGWAKLCTCGWTGRGQHTNHVAQAILASDWLAARLAEAEQRGREDNADHAMCYVHGSKALEARLEQAQEAAWDEGWNAAVMHVKFFRARQGNPYRTEGSET